MPDIDTHSLIQSEDSEHRMCVGDLGGGKLGRHLLLRTRTQRSRPGRDAAREAFRLAGNARGDHDAAR